ncbi:AtzH-like domain-containing protein [Phytohabitans rumicis]|uniref:Amidase domain-containing protein n=1 Tax=Phytohabitans rumicis TaxID=1076125 RepID=A0A6V8LH64_9ACTN|nr:AtzH-like domain-containing protein [Phytohabitans rumicis]GFJ95584.1 hypothetical protein Prum_092260 [Phytohabitans rumicis]
MSIPAGLNDAFQAYERALMQNDLETMSRLFADEGTTLRGDGGGLLIGHEQIDAFRRGRSGALPRELVDVQIQVIDDNTALIVAVTAARRGGHGLQTQLWRRTTAGWQVTAAHVSAPPTTFDPAVWRIVGDPLVPPTGTGDLQGQTVAVKDVFAVAGHAIGAGVPTYLDGQPHATTHASAVARLLRAGAAIRGIARTDQLTYSLAGDNPHYGTPVNALVPGALPGGSSSGPATAVALGAASIGLGTDTAGSIRVPASYQGLWGLRTTHGSVPVDGMVPLAPDFDTVGLLTRTPQLLRSAAMALAPESAFALSGAVVDLDELGLTDLATYAEAFRVHQAFQAWSVHGAWIAEHPRAVLGSAGERFAAASRITSAEDARAREVLDRARSTIDGLLGGAVLRLPAAAGPAPRLWTSPREVERARRATLELTCIAGITGRPALVTPGSSTSEGPVGRCLLGPPNSELALIAWTMRNGEAE